MAVLFTLAVAIHLPAQQLLNYELQPNSTFTPAIKPHAYKLTGSFALVLTPGTDPTAETFILTNLSLFYTSNSLTLDAFNTNAVMTEIPPGHHANIAALLDTNGDTASTFFLDGTDQGAYTGPNTAPTGFKVTETVTNTDDGSAFGKVVIIAKLIRQPIIPELTNLASFDGTNGAMSGSGLLRARDGSYYGTTIRGGTNNLGGIFKLTPTNRVLEVFSFRGTNGSSPQGGLILGKDGNFYGTTPGGGKFTNGAIFRMTLSGVVSNLFFFNGVNGATPSSSPSAALILGRDGNFYGTTYYGGAFNCGTIFKITPKGVLTTLASFSGGNGSHPEAPLVEDQNGNFYGTTVYGGAFFTGNDSFSGWGCVFRATPVGAITVLGSFSGTDGAGPMAALTIGPKSELYGTTAFGGNGFNHQPLTGDGTIFRVSERGGLIPIHYFNDSVNGGFHPEFASLVLNANGNFYGTTFSGGQFGGGTIFQMSPSGIVQTLISFDPDTGGNPWTGLSPGETSLIYYGTTTSGGRFDLGSVFRLTLPNPR